ncbi:MAG: amino acid permease [Xanthomonadales bacterium]|nr:amino acid permease [Xanthomonadales bacterium]
MKATTRQLGLVMATTLVVGNMIGSGVFLLPATLAPFGAFSLVGWVVSAVGALLVAGVFYRLTRRMPLASGPYAYTREAFGDCVGFLVAWMYWVGVVIGNAAIAVAFAGYFLAMIPGIGTQPLVSALVALAAIWSLTAVNLGGIRSAAAVQVVTTVLKVAPLLVLAIFGLAHFDPQLLVAGSQTGTPLHAINVSVAATLFAFLGVECATIPAGHVRDPARTIPRATLLGTVIAAVLYIACTAAVMGVVPAAQLATSQAPFALAGTLLWGSWTGWLIAGAATISCFGALNGWILIVGQFPQAVARDGLLPGVFARESGRGAPVATLLIAGVVDSVLVLANYSHGLVAMFTFLLLLTALSGVFAYLFSALAEIVLAQRNGQRMRWRNLGLALAAFAFTMWATLGAGQEIVYWTFALMLIGLPLYVWQVYKAQQVSTLGSEVASSKIRAARERVLDPLHGSRRAASSTTVESTP